ncbi:hypothetical protein MtrunA17_Chr1g0174191 [Medicago truncatula]|uniref:Uncharacterized protein n=1 Tax=Medicago truncatula TaxID=3880 RepID=A0A396H2Z3_MEDTR|nr:hypothetical protein MtrunA17_Chr7g0228701 [Medicago truncatula]RHN79172.1 hypothetical protein MtrunA17_Chr1g0174191 [Medicago truncatula]
MDLTHLLFIACHVYLRTNEKMTSGPFWTYGLICKKVNMRTNLQ